MASGPQEWMKEGISKGLQNQSYGLVVSLIIYWENGNPGFKEEGEKLGNFFRDRLGYVVKIFAIPRDDSHIQLLYFIINAVKETNELMEAQSCPGLIILHYGGHGDSYDDCHNGQQEQSVWAEQEKGATTVKWFEIQQHLQHAKSDLLLVLDCCFALRASQPQLTPQSEVNPAPSYQLLAAASHHEPTPLPGPRSFTSALLRRLEERFPVNDRSHDIPLTVTELIREIQTIKEPNLLIEPSHHAFTEGTIVIGPLTKSGNQDTESEPQWDGNILKLKLKIRHKVTKREIARLTRHFTLDCPDFVEGVELVDIDTTEASKAIKPTDVSRTSSIYRHDSLESGQDSTGPRRSPRQLRRGTIGSRRGVSKIRSKARQSGAGNA